MSESSSFTLGSEDGEAGTNRNVEVHASGRQRWSGSLEYILNVVVMCISIPDAQNVFTIKDKSRGWNMLQLIVMTIFVAMPSMYMQMVIGQYTQMSGIYLRYMCPIGHGMGYVFVISWILHLVWEGEVAADCIMYLAHSFQAVLPWRVCMPEHEKICWSDTECNEDRCLSETVFPSSFVYWNKTFMQIDSHEHPVGGRRLVTMVFVAVMAYAVLSCMDTVTKRSMIWGTLFAISVFSVTTLCLILLCDGAVGGIRWMMPCLDVDCFFNIDEWLDSISDVNTLFVIHNGGHILLASYLDYSKSSGMLAVLCTFSVSMGHCILAALIAASASIIFKSAKVDIAQAPYIPNFFNTASLTIVPDALGYTHFPQFLCTFFFTSCATVCLTRILISVKIVEINLADAYPNCVRYRRYFLFSFFAIYLFSSLFMSMSGLYEYVHGDFLALLEAYDSVACCIFTLTVAWIYSVQRFSDDIHFAMGSQPTRFWKLCWYVLPIANGVSAFYKLDGLRSKQHTAYLVLLLCLLFSPIIVMAVYEAFKYMLRKDLVGLFQKDQRWGPPMVEERHLREIFNPRKEIRSMRRYDGCQHKCLMNSKMLQRTVEEEAYSHVYMATANM